MTSFLCLSVQLKIEALSSFTIPFKCLYIYNTSIQQGQIKLIKSKYIYVIKDLFLLNFPLIKNPEIKCLMVSTKILSSIGLTVFNINNNKKGFLRQISILEWFLNKQIGTGTEFKQRTQTKCHKNDKKCFRNDKCLFKKALHEFISYND